MQKLMTMVASVAVAVAVAGPASAYPPGSTEPPQLVIRALAPTCVGDAPYIEYDVTGSGFTFPVPFVATLTFRDINGVFIEERTVNTPQGRVIYPGAAVDENGEAVDWPGWIRNADGFWVEGGDDAIWREGLNVTISVNPSATAFVTYPPATSACASPPEDEQLAPPPVTLPPTGSDAASVLQAGALLAGFGFVIVLAARRRRATA